MSLISLVVALIIIGFCLWLVQMLPIDGTIKTIINGIVILFVIVWILQSLGLIGSINMPVVR
jgi:hypothetical protein